MRLALKSAALLPILLATPALASIRAAAPIGHLSIGGVFSHAAPPMKLVAVLLVAAIVLAPALLVLGRASRLGVLAKGAPLLAACACLFTLLAASVGVANSPVVPSLTVLAPALAECLFLLVLGVLATFSAVVCRELAKPRVALS